PIIYTLSLHDALPISGVAECRLHGVRAIPLREDGLIIKHLRVGGLIGFHGPMGDIDPMGKEIGHGAAAKVPKPAPAVELFFAKGDRKSTRLNSSHVAI